ncbi:MAG: hypothetical protein COA52_00805 [Hyphomicrobiales bacterium]|nr:MAG: hypothetical protein COA52_00805 [Hyphomicrobiales bacterium]
MVASGPSAGLINKLNLKNYTVVAINNGWRATEEWNYWVKALDYKGQKPVIIPPQEIIKNYVDSLNKFGGIRNCGFSITLAASYWVLDVLKPINMFYLGCDMNYTPDSEGKTHIYGIGSDIQKNGISDPDKMVEDYSNGNENYLHDIYMRFNNIALKNGTNVYNLSNDPNTRLPFKRCII